LILVDTNIWSELSKRRPEPRVIAWLGQNEPQLHLSVFVIAELRRGCEMPKAKPLRHMFEAGLEQLEAGYADRIESFDAKDAHIYGRLAAMRALGAKVIDVQLAAQALARDATLATRNVKDFAWTGVRVVNPWNG
jgi:toxin FitB